MIQRIEDGSVPSILLLRYSDPWAVTDLVAVHRSLITREVIQQRKPLSMTAKRAGWIGCNILLRGIPPEGRIDLIKSGLEIPRPNSRAIFAATENLAEKSPQTRGWLRALLSCLHRIPKSTFSLDEVYKFEAELAALYPNNRNVRPKIRQQLQVLRDAGLLSFEGHGTYRLVYGRNLGDKA
jgi:type II restriction enzyme